MLEVGEIEAKDRWSELLSKAEKGEGSSITRDGQAVARLAAAYLELANRRGLPLASLDQPLRAAARQAGVAVL